MYEYNPIAESNNFIVLDKYEKYISCARETSTYQTEADLENEFIQDLRSQGYEYLSDLKTPEAMFENARVQLQILNDVQFTDSEWTRFCEEYLDKAGDNHIDKTCKIHNNYIYDFVFDDGHIKNIYLVKKEEKDIAKNKVQVISQFEQTGTQANRYDVKGKQYLRSLEKYYLVDIGLRSLLLGERVRDVGRILENIVYLELLRRGYRVSVGKVDTLEVDFVAESGDERIYYQVSASVLDPATYDREFRPLKRIHDNYPKYVLSMDDLPMGEDGIRQMNIIDFLLE